MEATYFDGDQVWLVTANPECTSASNQWYRLTLGLGIEQDIPNRRFRLSRHFYLSTSMYRLYMAFKDIQMTSAVPGLSEWVGQISVSTGTAGQRTEFHESWSQWYAYNTDGTASIGEDGVITVSGSCYANPYTCASGGTCGCPGRVDLTVTATQGTFSIPPIPPADYRPGEQLINGVWSSHNRSGGACELLSNGNWIEMKTMPGTGDPPELLLNGAWQNMEKIGAGA